MDLKQMGVHKSHCCLKHGCKYSSHECPVISGETLQDFPCEECEQDGETFYGLLKAGQHFNIVAMKTPHGYITLSDGLSHYDLSEDVIVKIINNE